MITCRLYEDGELREAAFDPSRVSQLLAGDEPARIWLDVEDPTDDELAMVGSEFGLHPLAIEDTHHRGQRPKVEVFGEQSFVVVRPLSIDAAGDLISSEIHAFAGQSFLVTLRYAPVFDIAEVVRRCNGSAGPTSEGAAFLLYVLMDEVVDDYLTIVEVFEDRADDVEDLIFQTSEEAGTQLQQRLFELKRDVVKFRRQVMPLRRVVDFFLEQPDFVTPALVPYFRDVADHVVRCVELSDNIRDLLTALLDVRIAQAANRLNEVMKKLTSWAAIILLPTLIAGIYGMNFAHMPELSWTLGYPLALGSMAVVSFVLWRVFKRKDWL